jgi:hypothetical protein
MGPQLPFDQVGGGGREAWAKRPRFSGLRPPQLLGLGRRAFGFATGRVGREVVPRSFSGGLKRTSRAPAVVAVTTTDGTRIDK